MIYSVLLKAYCSCYVRDADFTFLLQAIVIEMGNTLGVVVMDSVLRISVARGVLEAAEVNIHGK